MNHHQHTETIHYVISFLCFILLISCFATNLFTGKPALIRFDSLAGSFVLGMVFLVYSAWIVYEDSMTKQLDFSRSLILNAKKNPCLICVFLYWIVLVIIPFAINTL